LGAGLALAASQWTKHVSRGMTDPVVVFLATWLILAGLHGMWKARKKK
jgi:hypothetical protein